MSNTYVATTSTQTQGVVNPSGANELQNTGPLLAGPPATVSGSGGGVIVGGGATVPTLPAAGAPGVWLFNTPEVPVMSNQGLTNWTLAGDGGTTYVSAPAADGMIKFMSAGTTVLGYIDSYGDVFSIAASCPYSGKIVLGNTGGYSGLWASNAILTGGGWSLSNYLLMSEGTHAYLGAPTAAGNVYIRSGNAAGLVIDSVQKFHFMQAVDTSSTPGASGTNNASVGKVSIASGDSTFTLTNSCIGANDIVFAQTITAGQPAVVNSVVTAAGQVVFHMASAATATCKIAFEVKGFAA